MRLASLLYLASVAAAAFVATPVHAQEARTVILRFRKVGDTTVVIKNAQITVDHTIEAGSTDANGLIRIPDLEDGGHIVEAVARGYQGFFDKFVSGANIAMPIDLEIMAVDVVAKPKGQLTQLRVADFDQRRTAGAPAKFFTLAQLKAANGRPLANLLAVEGGATIVTGPRGESFLGTGAPSCYAVVVRDGLRIYPFETSPPPNLDKIFTDDLAAIELYPRAALAPGELRESSACGALVLWSR